MKSSHYFRPSRVAGFPWLTHVVVAAALAAEEMGRLGIFRYGIATGDESTTTYPWWRGDDVAWGGIALFLLLVMPWAVLAEAWAVVRGSVWLARTTVVGYTLGVAVMSFAVTTLSIWADTGIPVFILTTDLTTYALLVTAYLGCAYAACGWRSRRRRQDQAEVPGGDSRDPRQ